MREPLLNEAPLLEGLGVSKRYRTAATRLFAREGGLWGLGNAEGETVDFEVRRGESVAIVGESGSGKSTLLGMLLGLGTPTTGEIRFDGSLVFPRQRRDRMLWLRRRTGIVFHAYIKSNIFNDMCPITIIALKVIGLNIGIFILQKT